MKFTENFNLNLPDLDDISDIEKVNENFEKIDELIKENESDPALEAKVDEIKNKIGTESDADTQPTLFGRLAQLKNVLVEKLTEVITKITGIDSKIGTSSDTSEDETVFGSIKAVYNNLDIYDTIKNIKKEVVSVSVPGGSDNYTAIFNFSEGKKKINAIVYQSSEHVGTERGTCTITVDGTEYEFYSADYNYEDGVFLERLLDETNKRVLEIRPGGLEPYNHSVLKTVVENTFSVKMVVRKESTKATANLIIFYE